MRRGTTPTIEINVNGCDLSEFDTIYVTFKQGDVEVTYDNSEIDIEESRISFSLKQEDTLKFNSELFVYVQLRAVNKKGVAIASNIKHISVEDILKEGVISCWALN